MHRLIVVFLFIVGVASAEEFDLLFRGGEVIDGTGTEAVRADVGVKGDAIVAVGDLSDAEAARVIDATGKTIVPGFIDMHSHADEATGGGLRSNSEEKRRAPNLIAQGITTVVVNQDGRSPSSIARQRENLEERGFGPNAIMMIGHNSIRRKALGSDFRRASTDEEIEAMRAMIREGMAEGARGMTAGLEYVPGIWSTPEEVIALVEEIVPYGGTIVVHERSSGADPMWYVPSKDDPDPPSMIDNIVELIALSEKTGAKVVATHIKARGANFWGGSAEMVHLVNEARERGVQLFADQYPYTTSGSDGQIVLIPDWVWEAAREEADENNKPRPRDYAKMLRDALKDPIVAEAIRLDTSHEILRRGGAEQIVVMEYPDESYIGETLFSLSKRREVTAVEMAITLQLEGDPERGGGARLRGYSMNEEDVERFMSQPWTATGSDAGISLLDGGPNTHARFYGTYPRKIREYAIERGVITVEEAIRTSTSLPASIMGLDDRGVIREGNIADIAVIDLKTIKDMATFTQPHQYPKGVDYVMVNGKLVVDNGAFTDEFPGRVLASAPLDE